MTAGARATFGAESTAAEVAEGVDLGGKVAVVTGASGGIGLEAARAFASAGASVVLGNRPGPKSVAAADDLRASVSGARVEVLDLDLTSLASVRRFADAVLAAHPRVDLLVNNAGVMATPFSRTDDGFEVQLGVNHLGHFALTARVLPGLVAASTSRVVNVTSAAHHQSDVLWDDLAARDDGEGYEPWRRYGSSKTANILFTVELERRFGPRGVHAFAVHPGLVGTDLMRYLSDDDRAWLDRRVEQNQVPTKTPGQGAATTVYAAITPGLHGGTYLEDCHVSDTWAAYAHDAEGAARLWAVSEELTGEHFPVD